MSEENIELSHRAAEAFNRRDLDAFLALQASDVEGIPLASDMEGGYHGHAGTKRWWAARFDSFPDLTIEVVRMRARDDLTIWRVSQWRDGKCIWWGSFRTEATPRPRRACRPRVCRPGRHPSRRRSSRLVTQVAHASRASA